MKLEYLGVCISWDFIDREINRILWIIGIDSHFKDSIKHSSPT